MPWFIIMILAMAAHAVMWPVVTRWHYHNFDWYSYTDIEDRVFISAVTGFFWPVTGLVWGAVIAFMEVGRYATRPSRAERRQDKLKNLHKQIKAAEAQLAEATRQMEQTKHD